MDAINLKNQLAPENTALTEKMTCCHKYRPYPSGDRGKYTEPVSSPCYVIYEISGLHLLFFGLPLSVA